jgi:hypothetical protein
VGKPRTTLRAKLRRGTIAMAACRATLHNSKPHRSQNLPYAETSVRQPEHSEFGLRSQHSIGVERLRAGSDRLAGKRSQSVGLAGGLSGITAFYTRDAGVGLLPIASVCRASARSSRQEYAEFDFKFYFDWMLDYCILVLIGCRIDTRAARGQRRSNRTLSTSRLSKRRFGRPMALR